MLKCSEVERWASGYKVLHSLKTLSKDIPIIVLTVEENRLERQARQNALRHKKTSEMRDNDRRDGRLPRAFFYVGWEDGAIVVVNNTQPR